MKKENLERIRTIENTIELDFEEEPKELNELGLDELTEKEKNKVLSEKDLAERQRMFELNFDELEYLKLIRALFDKIMLNGKIKNKTIINHIDGKIETIDANSLEYHKRDNFIELNYINHRFNIDYKIILSQNNRTYLFLRNNASGKEMVLEYNNYQKAAIIIKSNNKNIRFNAKYTNSIAKEFNSISEEEKFSQIELALINELFDKLLEITNNNNLITQKSKARKKEKK